MTNRHKAKGDRGERDAVAALVEATPDLVLDSPKPMFGAGRKEDVGDLWVYPDVAVQVKNWSLNTIGQAMRAAAAGAAVQAGNGGLPLSLGLVPIPRARTGSVRWLACLNACRYPDMDPVAEFKQVSKLLAWIRDDEGPTGYRVYDRAERIGVLAGGQDGPVVVAPLEAWIAAYRELRAETATERPTSVGSIGHLAAS